MVYSMESANWGSELVDRVRVRVSDPPALFHKYSRQLSLSRQSRGSGRGGERRRRSVRPSCLPYVSTGGIICVSYSVKTSPPPVHILYPVPPSSPNRVVPLSNHDIPFRTTSPHSPPPRQVQEFHFLPLHSKWPLDSPESMFEGASEPGLPVFICVPGWHEPGHDPRYD